MADVADRTYYRGESGYQEARSAAVKNGRKPERFPDVIVSATSDADVIAAVRLAKRNGLKIGVRSGGHSWAGAFLRDGGMLIDLSQMNAVTVDREARTAEIQPGLVGTELNRVLRRDDLFFPTGHCMNVGLGGFLLQGGFGWNSRATGPACVSVRAIDVVTADGEMWHADARQSTDLLWAARGAGPGFFGVVTRFYLDVFPRPKVFMKSDYVYPIEAYDEVLRFVHAAQPTLPRSMECLGPVFS
jgi:FAD/FMN-containing dehydrogenase